MKIRYRDEGEGYPIIFIPPWTSSSLVFEESAKLLVDDGFRIIRVDLPGWGRHSGKMILEPTFDNYVEIVVDFVKKLKLKKYSLLGYSLGVPLIIHSIAKKRLNPENIFLISGFHCKKNLFEDNPKLGKRLAWYPRIRRIHFPIPIMKFIMMQYYMFEMRSQSIYTENREKWDLFVQIIRDNLGSDLKSAMTPAFTLPEDTDPKDLEHYKGEVLVIYNINEPSYYAKISEDTAKLFGVKAKTIEAFDHRHFSFQPESSVKYIEQILKK